MSEPHYLDLLREIKDVLVIDLSQGNYLLSDSLRAKLYQPIKGIYLKGSIDPFLIDAEGCEYYVSKGYDGTLEKIPFSDIMNSTSAICKVNGDVIINNKMGRDKKRFFTTTPNEDAIVCKLIRAVCIGVVNEYCIKTTPKRDDYDVGKFILPEYSHELVSSQTFDVELDHICREIIDFIGSDNWSIYTYRTIGRTFILEKGIDYRVFDWHRIQYEAAHPDDE